MLYLSGIFIASGLFWFLLLLTDAWRLRRLRKKYDESQDFSKKGEQARRNGGSGVGTGNSSRGGYPERERVETGVRGIENTNFTPAGQDKPTGQRILPPTTSKPLRENSPSFRVSDRYKY